MSMSPALAMDSLQLVPLGKHGVAIKYDGQDEEDLGLGIHSFGHDNV